MKRRLTSSIFSLAIYLFSSVFMLSHSQERITISGSITDQNNGETLIGATAYIRELQKGTVSNEYGFYSISVAPGDYTIQFGFLGYSTREESVSLTENITLNIELSSAAVELNEVVVRSVVEDRNVSEVEMSVNRLDMPTISKIPSLLGEVEILRSIQLLPGVTTVGEGASGFNVRGGSIDQNLVLLDEAPVYNSSHLFGFFSVFNPDAVKDVKLYKGGIPPRFGGRLASILDVRMREGNKKQFNMNGGIGLIFSRLAIEAPIVKDKASFIIAGRRSYIDVISKPFLNDDLKDNVLNFYDLTLKTNYKFSDNDHLFLSGYFGRDNFGFGDDAGFNWGNETLTLRWNHLFNERLFSNITLYFSDYDYELSFGDDAINRFDWDARIVNYSVKPELSYYLNPSNVLRFGGQGIIYKFEPGNAVGVSEGETRDISISNKYAIESALYLENELDLNSSIKMVYGLRFSHFNYTGKGIAYDFGESIAGQRRPVIGETEYDQWESIQSYQNLEPRISFKYQLNPLSSLKLSYNRTSQYIHLISNTTASTPVDLWTPSTNNIRPQIADQVALGYFRNLSNNMYEFSAEAYYKDMDHNVDYIDAADLLLNEFIEGDLVTGNGRAYGLELLMKKNKGKLTGWASYTLARTERQVEGINDGEWYPTRFDQTHKLNLSAFYELNSRWTFSSTFSYISGTPTTFPSSRFEQQGYVIPYNASNQRHNVRIPSYHRLDLSATLNGKKKEGKRFESFWVFSIYNVYSRRNPFSIYFRQEKDRLPVGSPVPTEAVQLSVVGNFIPSVSYNFKF